MTFHQRYFRSRRPHLDLVLARLQHEQAGTFAAVCDMVSIPYDLRPTLLATLLDQGYATGAGEGQIRLTARGVAAALALQPEAPEAARGPGRRPRRPA